MRCGGIIYDSIVLNTVLPLYSLVIFPANSIETHDKSIRQHGFTKTGACGVVWLPLPPPSLPPASPTWLRVILPFCPTFLLLNLLLILYCCATEFLGDETCHGSRANCYINSRPRCDSWNLSLEIVAAISPEIHWIDVSSRDSNGMFSKIIRSNIRYKVILNRLLNRFVLPNKGGKIYLHHACKRM